MKNKLYKKEENKQMKRRVLTLALGMAMVFGLMVNANAATAGGNLPSNQGGDDVGFDSTPSTSTAPVKPDEPVVNPEGVTVTTDPAELPPEEAAVLEAAIEAITSAESTAAFVESAGIADAVKEVLAEANKTAAVAVAVEDLVPAATFSVSASGEAAKVLAETGSVTLAFDVVGVADGDTVLVLVFDGTNWTVVPATVKNGKVEAAFTTLGTVVIMKADQAAAERVTSPQTSGANFEGVILACGVVMSLAVLALCIKRSRMA